jgi:hypothetical protein
MSLPSDRMPTNPPVSPVKARQGVISGRVILVLGASLTLAIVGMLVGFWVS